MVKRWYRLDLIEERRGKRKDISLDPVYIYEKTEERCRKKLKYIGNRSRRINRRSFHILGLFHLSETGSRNLEEEILEESAMTLHNAKRRWYRTKSVYD